MVAVVTVVASRHMGGSRRELKGPILVSGNVPFAMRFSNFLVDFIWGGFLLLVIAANALRNRAR